MTRYHDWDDFDYEPYDWRAEEERETREYQAECARIIAMTPEQLAKEWQRQCRRHDFAIDRCEEINSPTIESAQGWMNFIERQFTKRGLNKFDFLIEAE